MGLMRTYSGNRKKVRFEIYADFAGRYRWRLRGCDGRIIADSPKSYLWLDTARMAAQQIKAMAPNAEVDGDPGTQG